MEENLGHHRLQVYLSVGEENVLSQSTHLPTLLIANQNTEKTVENEERIIFYKIRKERTHNRLLVLRIATHIRN